MTANTVVNQKVFHFFKVTIGYLKATVVHFRVTLGHLKVTIGYFFLSANRRQTTELVPLKYTS